jgi:hypothetical protein
MSTDLDIDDRGAFKCLTLWLQMPRQSYRGRSAHSAFQWLSLIGIPNKQTKVVKAVDRMDDSYDGTPVSRSSWHAVVLAGLPPLRP